MEKNLSVLDILNKWVEYSEYDPDQKCFIMGSKNYEMNKSSKLASKILDLYDKTGNMSVIMLKESFLNILKDERVSVLSIVQNNGFLDKTIEMYNMFCSNTVKNAYIYFNDIVKHMYKEVIGIELIGENRENYASWIESIVNDVERLGVDIYKKDGKPLKIEKFYKKLLVFNSLGEAVLTLERAEDGVYTCYINVGYTSDSYFGFFVKSGGNFVGFTDRINEEYPWQHKRLNVRNGRWADNKSDTIFPYGTILDYDNYCSKGYAMKFKVKESFSDKDTNSIEFKDLEFNYGYDGIILGMILLKMRYNDKIIDGDEVYIESLLKNNINILINKSTNKNELMTIEDSSIALRNKDIDINFSLDQIIGENVPFEEFKNGDIVRIYGKGFEPDYSKVYESDNIKKLVDTHYEDSIIKPEYVGSKERLEKGAYYIIREQLADYIDKQIEKEWVEKGGLKAYKKWYMDAIKDNLSNLLNLCMQKVVNDSITEETQRKLYGTDYHIHFIFGERYAKDEYLMYDQYINDRNDSNSFMCPITGTSSSIFFVLEPITLDGISMLTGREMKDIPTMIKLGKMHRGYGNSLLNMEDPVKKVIKPFGDNKINGEYTRYNFKVAIGISKRAFNKLLKIVK